MVRPLRPGSLVDVIAQSSPFDAEGFRSGIHLLESLGYRVRHRPDVFERQRFLAGSDERRRDELLGALAASDSDVVWCARGGYGATRLLGDIPLETIRKAGKLLVGFSDVTALHARWLVAGVPSVHGSMIARLASEPEDVRSGLLSLLARGRMAMQVGAPVVAGVAEGVLTGGNLALLAAMCGTPYQPDFKGRVVFLEDIGERPYRLDRMLVQCAQAGLFRGVAGIALGEFLDCDDAKAGISSAEVLREHVESLGVPVVAALPSGHGKVNHALPFGVRVRIDGGAGTLTQLESLFPEAVA